jgi:hypothetical protein
MVVKVDEDGASKSFFSIFKAARKNTPWNGQVLGRSGAYVSSYHSWCCDTQDIQQNKSLNARFNTSL